MGGLYFHRRKQKEHDEEMTPYEKWAKNEELKNSGSGPAQFTRYSLNPRLQGSAHNPMGDGLGDVYNQNDDPGYINNPMKGSQHNPMNDSQRPDRFDEEGDYDSEGNWVSTDAPEGEPDEDYDYSESEDDEPEEEPEAEPVPAPVRQSARKSTRPSRSAPMPPMPGRQSENYDQFRQSQIYGGRKSTKGRKKMLE